jgi:hypothetical protein
MKRRVLLGAIPFALTGCLSSLPGPTGPRNPPTEPEDNPRERAAEKPLVVSDFRFKRADDDTLRVVLTVTNRTDSEQTGTVTGSLTFEGEDYERTSEVTVDGDGQVETELFYEAIEFEAFQNADSFDFSASVE